MTLHPADTTLLIELLYASSTVLLVLAGLTMVGFAGRAYARTGQPAFVYLALGFTFIAAAGAATAISAFMLDFRATRSLLLVNNGITILGYSFVVYSLRAYRASRAESRASTRGSLAGD